MKEKKPERQQRQSPVRIPLPFETAVEGLLAVKPTPKKKPTSAKKKPGRK